MVRFENVGMRYGPGPEVLRDISLQLPAASFHFLTGLSGAGKSSLLKLMYLAHKPSRGLVTMFDYDIATASRERLAALRRRIGVVFQDFRLLEHLSVAENVALPLRIGRAPEAEVTRKVRELLEWVGLGPQQDQYPSTLSGGEQQRAAVARAVITRPALLVADEPTGNLDDAVGYRLLRLFEEMHRAGTTVVVASHNRLLIDRFPHPRLELRDGELVLPPALRASG